MKNTYQIEESLGYIVGRAGRAMANRLNQNFEKGGYDVTCEQWAVLMNLWRKNSQSQKELAGITCKDKTSITRLIDGLEKRKLVTRTTDKKDGRHKLICLTKKGLHLQLKLLKLVEGTLTESQSGINLKDLQICKNVLKRVVLNLT